MKLNKKGFTIVELVIVIAVIAILAAVLIPTFSSVIEKANKSSAEQAVTASYQDALAEVMSDGSVADGGEEQTVNGIKFTITEDSGTISATADVTNATNDSVKKYDFTFNSSKGKWTAADKS